MVPKSRAPQYSGTMPRPSAAELAQRVVLKYVTDLALNGPIDISQFTDEVLEFENGGDTSLATEVDKLAIEILQRIGRDLL